MISVGSKALPLKVSPTTPKEVIPSYALWLVRDVSRVGCLRLLFNMYRGKPCGEFHILRGRTELSSPTPVALEYDGDPHGSLPVSVALAERRLRLIVPRLKGDKT